MRKFSRSVGWLAVLTVLLTLATPSKLYAQSTTPRLRCGTIDLTPAEQEIVEQAAVRALSDKKVVVGGVTRVVVSGVTYVPIRLHIIRRSNGTGGMTLARMNKILALTNRQFITANIRFFFAGASPDYIDDDGLYANYVGPDDTSPNDEARFNGRDAVDALNMYFINTTNDGYGAYAYRPANRLSSSRLIIRADQSNSYLEEDLVAHELGHTFNLLHTFGNNNGNGTLTSELVNGSNCTTAGDLVCDTPADPYGHPNATADGCFTYTGTVRDANGALFQPALNNTMSYWDHCGPEFSTGQYSRIGGGLALRQSYSTFTLNAPSTAVAAPTNVYAVVNEFSTEVAWRDNANNEMGYFIERATAPGGPFTPVGGVAPNITSFTDNVGASATVYYYRIRPSNSADNNVSAVRLAITGNENLCNTGTYTVNSGGVSPVTWAVTSFSPRVTPTSGVGNTAVLTALPTANDSFLSLEFTVGSGASAVTLSKTIYATYTPAPSMTTAAGQTIAAPGQTAVTVQQFTGNVLFTADNCSGGTINWSGGGLSGTGILVAPTSAVGTVTYTSTCTRNGCTGPASTVTVTVTAGPTPLLVVTPAFNCNTGLFVFQTVGGNGTPIEFSAIGITGWTTVPQHSIASNLRNDATLAPFTLRARQSGREVQISWDLRAFCNSPNLTPLLIDNPIPNLTGTVGQLFQYTIPANTFRDPDGQPLTYSATGLPAGLGLSNGTISGVPSTTGVFNAVVTASDPGGRSIGTGFTISINPAAGSSTALQLVAPTYNCATGSLTFQTTGGNGTPIEFMAVGITGWSTTATHVLPLSLRTDINLAPFTLMARQGGTVVAFAWDLRAACTIGTINQPPVSTPVPAQIGVVGQPYNFNLNTYFSDPDGQALVYSLSGLPNGLAVSTSGFITGTPTTAGVSSVQVTARDPFFQQTTQTFFFTVNPAGPVVGALALIAPLYDCQTGQFVFRATGGNGTPIEFRSVGVTDWTTSVNHVISPVLINEPGTQPFLLQARQNGVVVTLNWNLRLACSAANLPPIQLRPLPAQVATVGQPFTFDLSSYFGDPESLALQYSLDVLGGTIGGLVVNGVTGVITGLPTNAGAFNLGVRVTDVNGSNIVASMAFVINPAPIVPISSALQLIAPSYNCATRQLTFNTSGGNGSLIEFRAVGVTDWSSNANHVIEAGVTADLNNSLITLMARQSGVNVSYPFNFRTGCPGARLGADEPKSGLVVTVRGNPISGDEVELDVNGAEGQSVQFRLIDTGGRIVTERAIERAVSTERVRMRLGQQAGLYLIQVSTANQRTTVRALRVN